MSHENRNPPREDLGVGMGVENTPEQEKQNKEEDLIYTDNNPDSDVDSLCSSKASSLQACNERGEQSITYPIYFKENDKVNNQIKYIFGKLQKHHIANITGNFPDKEFKIRDINNKISACYHIILGDKFYLCKDGTLYNIDESSEKLVQSFYNKIPLKWEAVTKVNKKLLISIIDERWDELVEADKIKNFKDYDNYNFLIIDNHLHKIENCYIICENGLVYEIRDENLVKCESYTMWDYYYPNN